jgi:hypothetical protein
MMNPATQPQNELNDFTNNIRVIAKNSWGKYWIQLRDGTLVRPVLQLAEHPTEESAFYAEGHRYCWNLDGTSVTNPRLDMMEIVRND